MADVHEPAVRSYNMSRIRGKDTKPEMRVRKYLHAEGFRFRLHQKDLPGKPDIVLKKYKTVVMINGCFWHGHEGCRYFVIPKTRTEWWTEKIGKTQANDRKHLEELVRLGWKVLVVWECELKGDQLIPTLEKLAEDIERR